MATLLFGLLIGLEVKHYIADYLLQPGWVLAGKGNIFHPGGYAHAGLHAVLSIIVLLVFGVPLSLAAALFVAEFVLHYALDFAKVRYSQNVQMETAPGRFWALHGTDQLAHQLTYVAMIYVVLDALGYL